jgi:hypothetical protein
LPTSVAVTEGSWPDVGGASYGGDGTYGATSLANVGPTPPVNGVPLAAFHGGGWNTGTRGGIYALALSYAPTSWHTDTGFRCVVPR